MKVYEGTLIERKEGYEIPSHGAAAINFRLETESKNRNVDKLLFTKVTPNTGKELVSGIVFPLVKEDGGFFQNDSLIEARAFIVGNEDFNVVEDRDKVEDYIEERMNNYEEHYNTLLQLQSKNGSIKDGAKEHLKAIKSLVKEEVEVSTMKEQAKLMIKTYKKNK